MNSLVQYRVDRGVGWIRLDDPERRNALSDEMLDELIRALKVARDTTEARCVVVESTHPTVFCAGADLATFSADESVPKKFRATDRFVKLFCLLGRMGKPSICAARGHVLGGGLGLALACDLIIASDDATFGTPEINVGAFPFIIAALVYRNIPRKIANELVLYGDRIDARRAYEIGIANNVAARDSFAATVDDWAQRLAAKSPMLLRLGKDALYRQQDMSFEDALEYLHHNLVLSFTTDDTREGVTAFFERREPRWMGR